MKNVRKIFLSLALLVFCSSAFAQETTKHGPYVTAKWFDNTFVGVAGGKTFLVNGYNIGQNYFRFKNQNQIEINIGKWVTPNIGVRLQGVNYRASGWNPVGGRYQSKRTTVDGVKYAQAKFHGFQVHADLLLNLSNAIGGYREDRFWDVIPFAGFGWTNSSRRDLTPIGGLAAFLGITNDLRITEALDATIEVKSMFSPTNFDGYRQQKITGVNRVLDLMPSATIGLSYNFPCGKNADGTRRARGFERLSTYTNEIDALKDQLTEQEAAVKKAQDDLAAATKKAQQEVAAAKAAARKAQQEAEQAKADAMANAKVDSDHAVALFFGIGKTVLSEKEKTNLDFFVKNCPKDRKYVLTGMADSATGTPSYNQLISERRAQYVFNLLVNKYGVNPDNITKVAKGSKEDLFKTPALNRIVIVQ